MFGTTPLIATNQSFAGFLPTTARQESSGPIPRRGKSILKSIQTRQRILQSSGPSSIRMPGILFLLPSPCSILSWICYGIPLYGRTAIARNIRCSRQIKSLKRSSQQESRKGAREVTAPQGIASMMTPNHVEARRGPDDECRVRDNSFVRIVLPFRLSSDGRGVKEHEVLEADATFPMRQFERVGQAMFESNEWEPLPERDKQGLLPHIGRWINFPVVSRTSNWDSASCCALYYRLSSKAINHRFQFAEVTLGSKDEDRRNVPIKVAAVEVVLFSSGVGFIVAEIRSTSGGCILSDWLDLVYQARFADPISSRGRGAEVRVGPSQGTAGDSKGIGKFLLECASELGMQVDDSGEEHSGDVPSVKICMVGSRSTMLAYAVSFIDCDRAPAGEDPSSGNDRVDWAVTRLERFVRSDSLIRDVEAAETSNRRLPYTRGSWFFRSLDGAGFISLEANHNDGFHSGTLPNHLRRVYFIGYLLGLHQRFALEVLSDRFVETEGRARTRQLRSAAESVETHAADREANSKKVADLKKELARFQTLQAHATDILSRHTFVQAMHSENHQRAYGFWCDHFELDKFREEAFRELKLIEGRIDRDLGNVRRIMEEDEAIRESSRERREKIRDRREEIRDRYIAAVGVAFVVVALIIDLATFNLDGSPGNAVSWQPGRLLLSVFAIAVGVVVATAIRCRVKRSQTEAEAREAPRTPSESGEMST